MVLLVSVLFVAKSIYYEVLRYRCGQAGQVKTEVGEQLYGGLNMLSS